MCCWMSLEALQVAVVCQSSLRSRSARAIGRGLPGMARGASRFLDASVQASCHLRYMGPRSGDLFLEVTNPNLPSRLRRQYSPELNAGGDEKPAEIDATMRKSVER